jgi:phosphatidylserine/phosphatidylglycerophosphate/cardiolipin synthase-like enzyme
VVKTITQARQSVRVAAYELTSKPIAEALLDDHTRVSTCSDRGHEPDDIAILLGNPPGERRHPCRVDDPHAIMHDKFIVVDGETLETASFDFTSSAESRNAENVLTLHDATGAAQYGQEWERLWDESQRKTKRY